MTKNWQHFFRALLAILLVGALLQGVLDFFSDPFGVLVIAGFILFIVVFHTFFVVLANVRGFWLGSLLGIAYGYFFPFLGPSLVWASILISASFLGFLNYSLARAQQNGTRKDISLPELLKMIVPTVLVGAIKGSSGDRSSGFGGGSSGGGGASGSW